MSKLYDYILDDNGLMMKLRMDNEFDEGEYEKIKNTLLEIIPEWKKTGKVTAVKKGSTKLKAKVTLPDGTVITLETSIKVK